MKRYLFSPNFKKAFRKLSLKIREKAFERLDLLLEDEFNPELGNHKLNPRNEGKRSIDITGDMRIIYQKKRENLFYLVAIGTHSQLYGK